MALGQNLRRSLADGCNDGSIGVEQIISSHSRLARNSSWNDNNLGTLKTGLDLLLALESSHLGLGLAVGEVGDDGGVDDVVESQLGHGGVELQEHGEWLTNTSTGSHHSNTSLSHRTCGQLTSNHGDWLLEPGEHLD